MSLVVALLKPFFCVQFGICVLDFVVYCWWICWLCSLLFVIGFIFGDFCLMLGGRLLLRHLGDYFVGLIWGCFYWVVCFSWIVMGGMFCCVVCLCCLFGSLCGCLWFWYWLFLVCFMPWGVYIQVLLFGLRLYWFEFVLFVRYFIWLVRWLYCICYLLFWVVVGLVFIMILPCWFVFVNVAFVLIVMISDAMFVWRYY